MSQITQLATGQNTAVDVLTIELVEARRDIRGRHHSLARQTERATRPPVPSYSRHGCPNLHRGHRPAGADQTGSAAMKRRRSVRVAVFVGWTLQSFAQ